MSIKKVEKIQVEEVPALMEKISSAVNPLGVHILSDFTVKANQRLDKAEVDYICLEITCYKDGK